MREREQKTGLEPEWRHLATGFERRVKTDGDTLTLTGMPIRYGSPYTVTDPFGEFRETMHPGVAKKAMAAPGFDCRFLENHGGLPLARTASGTLELEDTPEGLRCIVHLDGRQRAAQDLAYAVERGDLTQMSCGFVVGEDEWGASGGVETRDVYSFADLFDVSAVTYPASPSTTLAIANRLAASPVGAEVRERIRARAARNMPSSKPKSKSKDLGLTIERSRKQLEKAMSETETKPRRSAFKDGVKAEPLVYGEGSDRSFFLDHFRYHLAQTKPALLAPRGSDNEPAAIQDRLLRHQKQMAHLAATTEEGRRLFSSYFRERNREWYRSNNDRSRSDFTDLVRWNTIDTRAVSTGGGSMGDFAPPIYVLEKWQLYRTAASPVASQAAQGELPATGMTVDIPQMTGGVTMGVQSSENTNISNSSPAAAYVSSPVYTAAGIVEISQQTLDRFGPGVRADEVIAEQAARDAGTTIDTQAITVLLTDPLETITNSNSPSITALWEDVAKAKAAIATTEGTRLQATHTIIPPLNMAWYQAQVDSEGRPIWSPSAASTLARVGQANTRSEGYSGYDLMGTQAFEDANLPTTNSGADASLLVADLPNGLLVLTGTPIVDVWPEFDPATLTAAIVVRQFFSVIALYDAAVEITGASYPAAPTFTGS